MQIQRWKIENSLGHELIVRPIEVSEAEILKSWMDSSEVTRNLIRTSGISLEDEKNWISSTFKSDDTLLIGVEVDSKLIGSWTLNLKSWETGSNIGNQEYHGKGIGTLVHTFRTWYTFEQLNLPLIRSRVIWDENDKKYQNWPSFKALSKVGYVETGITRCVRFFDGKWRSTKDLECYNPKHWMGTQPEDISKSIEITKQVIQTGYEIIKRI